jgi:hypothetical protein
MIVPKNETHYFKGRKFVEGDILPPYARLRGTPEDDIEIQNNMEESQIVKNLISSSPEEAKKPKQKRQYKKKKKKNFK